MRVVLFVLLLSVFGATHVQAQAGDRIGLGRTASQWATGAGVGIGMGLVMGFASQKIAGCSNDCTDQLGIGYMSGTVIGTALGVQLQGRGASNRLTFIAATAGSIVGAQLMIGLGENFEFGAGKTLALATLPAVTAVAAHALARAGIRRQRNLRVGVWRVGAPQVAILPDPSTGSLAYHVQVTGVRF